MHWLPYGARPQRPVADDEIPSELAGIIPPGDTLLASVAHDHRTIHIKGHLLQRDGLHEALL